MKSTLPQMRTAPSTPPGSIVYAVGDIHGRADLLAGALAELRRAAAEAKGRNLVVVFLGDYIDRGPSSREVLSRLISFRHEGVCETVFLRGNHEQVLLDLIDGFEDTGRWLDYGGQDTLRSYGLERLPEGLSTNRCALTELVQRALPADHLAFLRETELHAKRGDYLFVHAGLRPDRLLEEQSTSDMLWYRYYDDEAPVHAETVVHGHSPHRRPILGRWRIGLDTEAYASGSLTMLRLEGEDQTFLRAHIPPEGVSAQISRWATTDPSYAHEPHRSERPVEALEAPPTPKPRKAARPRAVRLASPALALVSTLVIAAGLGAAYLAFGPPLTPPRAMSAQVAPPTPPVATPSPPRPVPAPEAPPPTEGLRGAIGAEAPPTPQPAPVQAPAAPTAGARVQIGALASESGAAEAWQDVAKQYPSDMQGRSMAIEPVTVGSRTVYRAYVAGFADETQAAAFCRKLAASGRGCILRRATG